MSSPNAEYTMSGSDLSASPPGEHEAQHLRMPGQRSYSAPPDSVVHDAELRMRVEIDREIRNLELQTHQDWRRHLEVGLEIDGQKQTNLYLLMVSLARLGFFC